MLIKKSFVLLILFLILLLSSSFAKAVMIDNPLQAESFSDLIKAIAEIISSIVGVLAVLMLIIAGIYFVTAAGDPNQISKAKTMVKYAIIGVIIATLAGAIGSVIEEKLLTKGLLIIF